MIQKRGYKIPSHPQKDKAELEEVKIRARKVSEQSKITTDAGSITKEWMFVSYSSTSEDIK